MARIFPFRAVRPTNDKVHLVASRSYVTYSNEQMRDKLKHNPYSFIQIIHPDFDTDDPSEPGTPIRFERVRDRYRQFIGDGIFERDEAPGFYVYRQTHDRLDSIGIILAAHADDYRCGHIKVHEQTLAVREALFADYLETTGFNAEPILLTHEDDDSLNGWLMAVSKRTPDVHFTTADEVTHYLWKVDDPEECAFVSERYAKMEALYIADGHHRSASSVLLADRWMTSARANSQHPVNAFMAYVIPASKLVIHGYHRLIRPIEGLTAEKLLKAVEKIDGVTLENVSETAAIPARRHIDLYADQCRTRIHLPDDVPAHLPDADWLTTAILDPIMRITDLRNDERISFAPETDGIASIVNRVDRGKFDYAFILRPVPFSQLKAVSDQGATMPPKSTWIEPKLRSGLVIYDFTYQDTLEK